MHVHIQRQPDLDARAALDDALDEDVRLTFGDNPPDDADYAVLVSGRPSRALLDASPALSTLVIPFAGVPDETLALMHGYSDIAVHNLHHNAPATAELAMALLLAAAKHLVPMDARLRKGDWSDRGRMERALQLNGRVALVLGYGKIGRRVAKACAALGMEVKAIARRRHNDEFHEPHTPDKLPEFLPQADALIICLPATQQTKGMIGRQQLAMLPRTAIVVNVARGSIIDEAALFDALKQGRIFGAGLDVWWNYPASKEESTATPPAGLPFQELDNVVLSPHRGGHVSDTEPQRMRALARLINAAARGDEIPNKVDLAAGY